MTYDSLNKLINHYIERDKTGRAIMLTSDWGTGKSYYIRNSLVPFLNRDGKRHCVIVSLYGINTVEKISQNIYIGLRTIAKFRKNELLQTSATAGKIVGKTVLNLITNIIGFDIGNLSDRDLKKVYESIDLTGKLIIFEDVERSQIDIIDFLGFVNNLTEQDGAKVLLVVNEKELIQYNEIDTQNGEKRKEYTEKSLLYLKAKEKSIGDTINFTCDYDEALSSIISLFDDSDLNEFKEKIFLERISELFYSPLQLNNLRHFLSACQKTSDIFSAARNNNINLDEEVKCCVFYSLVYFMQKSKNVEIPKFPMDQFMTSDLGWDQQYPLFRFCYLYIVLHQLDIEDLKLANKKYSEYLLYGRWNQEADEDIKIIRNFHVETESDVKKAIPSVIQKLQNNVIPYCYYGILANYIVAIEYLVELECDYQKCKHLLIDNLKGKKDEIEFDLLFSSSFTLHDSALKEFNKLKEEMKLSLEDNKEECFFEYDTKKIDEFCTKITKQPVIKILREGFASRIEVEKFINLLKSCSARDISKLRSLFLHLFYGVGRSLVNEDDIFTLNSISQQVSKLQDYSNFDNIQKLQIRLFSNNLQEIMRQFTDADDFLSRYN